MSSTSNIQSHVPPGFRFHPTDEELVEYYLKKKIECKRIDLDVIREIELYKIEPWDLQELCKIGSTEQSEWYFFSHKDKKYPTGTRTNRATNAGFWKATGRDKAIYTNFKLIGMRKTLVFYKGRAPNGQKTDWIMHEYRLETCNNASSHLTDDGWVVCRVFRKRSLTYTRRTDMDDLQPFFYDDQLMMLPEFESPKPHHFPTSIQSQSQPQLHTFGNNTTTHHQQQQHHPHSSSCKQELLDYQFPIPFHNLMMHHHQSTSLDPFQNLPYLEETPTKLCPTSSSSLIPNNSNNNNNNNNTNNNSLIKSFLSMHGIANQRPKPLCIGTMNPLNEGGMTHQYSNNLYTSTNNNHDGSLQMGLGNGMTDWRVLDKLVASQLSNQDDNNTATSSSCTSKEGCLIPHSASTNFLNLDKLDDDGPIVEAGLDHSNHVDAGNIWNLGKREQDLIAAMHSEPDIFHSN